MPTNPIALPVRKKLTDRCWYEIYDKNNRCIIDYVNSEELADYLCFVLNNINKAVEVVRKLEKAEDDYRRMHDPPDGDTLRWDWLAEKGGEARAFLADIDAEKAGTDD